MSRHAKLTVWALVLGILPFVIFVGAISYSVVNGVTTRYDYLNLAALAGGVIAVCIAVVMVRRDPESGQSAPRWAWAVGAALFVLGAFQVVRGLGVLPDLIGCVSESGTMGICTPTTLE